MTDYTIATARRWFAEELRHTAHVRSASVVEAFATVPREHFAGPGPWRILSPMHLAEYWTTEDADPRHLYHDVLIAIDEARGLNNGQPSLWAFLYDQLNLAPGANVVHVGVGTGYYSAVLAEIVGPHGRVTAVEIDPVLAGRARTNLAPAWPQATVITADGFTFRPDHPADAIIVNAGVTHLPLAWLELAGQRQRTTARAFDRGGQVWRIHIDHAPSGQNAPLCRSSRLPRGHDRLCRRTQPGRRSEVAGGIENVAVRTAGSLAAAPTGRTGRDLLAGRRRVVAVDCAGLAMQMVRHSVARCPSSVCDA